jgi:Fe-Mn family superoxide dismutase
MTSNDSGRRDARGTDGGTEVGSVGGASASPTLNRRAALAALGAVGGVAAMALAQPTGQPKAPQDPYRPGGIAPPTAPGQPAPGGAGHAGVLDAAALGWDEAKGEFVLPPLPYAPEALEPHIDKATMELHHGRHHQAYVTGLNRALRELKDIREGGNAALVQHWSRQLSFHGAGHVNHAIFWRTMAPAGQGGGGAPTGDLAAAITRDFGSFDAFSAHFKAAAQQVEGDGWAWLVLNTISRRLVIIQVQSQQDQIPFGMMPLLGVDVWEHAYYLKYQNRRADYVNAFMNVAAWGVVGRLYAAGMARSDLL